MVSYPRRYGEPLFSGRLAELEGVHGERNVMTTLANLAKFMGRALLFEN